jgi:tRNA (guanine-N7-)-methyltransferase
MKNAAGFANKARPQNYPPQPLSPADTRFQRRGEKYGHGVWDLIYERAL